MVRIWKWSVVPSGGSLTLATFKRSTFKGLARNDTYFHATMRQGIYANDWTSEPNTRMDAGK